MMNIQFRLIFNTILLTSNQCFAPWTFVCVPFVFATTEDESSLFIINNLFNCIPKHVQTNDNTARRKQFVLF